MFPESAQDVSAAVESAAQQGLRVAAQGTGHNAGPLGALDDDPGVKPGLHVFVAYTAPWFDITDDLPQYPELP